MHTGDLKELTLTTNGSQLDRYSEALFNYGVKRVNVSLDTLNEKKKFKILTRLGDINKVISGIMKAKSVGLKVKINFVALKNVNDDELFFSNANLVQKKTNLTSLSKLCHLETLKVSKD